MKIQSKLITLALVSSLVPLLVASVISFLTAQQSIRDLVNAELESASQSEMTRLRSFFVDARLDMNSWASLTIMQDVLTDDEDEAITQELVKLQKHYSLFMELIVLNDQGKVVSALDNSLIDEDFSEQAIFTESIKGAAYQDTVRNWHKSSTLALVLTDPIRADYDKDTIIGVLVGVISWAKVQQALSRVTIIGKPQDQAHQLILMASKSKDVLYDTIFNAKTEDKVARAHDLTLLSMDEGVHEQELSDVRFLVGTSSSLTQDNSAQLNWHMHVLVDETYAYASVITLGKRILIFGVFILAVAIAVGIWFSRSLSKPILSIIHFVDDVAVGNLESRIELQPRDELGALIKSLKTMQSTLVQNRENDKSARIIARIKQALDVCRANIMLANNNMNIVYLNDSIQQMMSSAEPDIQSKIPDFATAKLMGANVDELINASSPEQIHLGVHEGIFKMRWTIAGRIFNLVATPVLGGGERLGTVVEWQEVTRLEQTATSIYQMSGEVKQTADNLQQADQLAVNARDGAVIGGEAVNEAIVAMDAINTSSNKISEIIGVINKIAFQTNLLALNASIEAARAGEKGRGFGVVATEVRNLAQRSAAAAMEIKEIIEDSAKKVKTGGELVSQSGETLGEIVMNVKKLSDIISETANTSRKQASGIVKINETIAQLNELI